MLRKMVGWLPLLLLAVGVVLLWKAMHGYVRERWYPSDSVRVDTIVERDTVVTRMPVARDSVRVRVVRVAVRELVRDTLRDSVVVRDSVEIPIVQKVYEDSLYTAWVSGYGATLDSIRVVRVTRTVEKKPPRWGIGLQGGVGVTPKGVLPYVGVGVSWRLK